MTAPDRPFRMLDAPASLPICLPVHSDGYVFSRMRAHLPCHSILRPLVLC